MGDGPEHRLRLAQSLIAAGHQVTVVTPQWKRAWPSDMCIGPVRLVRLRGSLRGGWSTIRWMYALARWLPTQTFDAVLVCGLRHEAYVALRPAEQRPWPVLVLADEDDLNWHTSALFGSRIAARCLTAPAVVAYSHEQASALCRAGFSSGQVTVIARSAPIPSANCQQQRDAARAALVSANHDLLTTASTRVALAIGRLDATARLGDLVRAWRIVTARHPHARLWIVGDGPERDKLYRQIGDLDQRFRVFLPGTFDCHDELLAAADLLLVAAPHQTPPLILLEAQAAGLPVIAARSPAMHQYVVAEHTGLDFEAGDFRAIADAVDRLLKDPEAAVQLGAAARQAAQGRPTPADEAAAYVELVQRLRSAG
jgi:glycosyltransferase involved in cell wall biosynthesis